MGNPAGNLVGNAAGNLAGNSAGNLAEMLWDRVEGTKAI